MVLGSGRWFWSPPPINPLHRGQSSTSPSTANTEVREMESVVKDWIKPDEAANEMLTRIFTMRPFLPLPPPLHKIPLRAGNVVEIVGPSSSAKTHILMQAAISCILPKEWKGVQYGGMERLAAFVDLDCRFDIVLFSQLLKRRIIQANGNDKMPQMEHDQELFAACMRRFLYIRCYDSFEFLATLKTMNYRLQKEKEIHGFSVHLLMLDSIGAFHWIDRALPALSLGEKNSLVVCGCCEASRKNVSFEVPRALDSGAQTGMKSFSLQSVTENVVQEIQKLLLVHPIVVLASKTASLREKFSRNEVMRSLDNRYPKRWPLADALDLKNERSGPQALLYREYMPLIWQSFVTHRVHVCPSDGHSNSQRRQIYLTKWLLPSIKSSDTFTVNGVCRLVYFSFREGHLHTLSISFLVHHCSHSYSFQISDVDSSCPRPVTKIQGSGILPRHEDN